MSIYYSPTLAKVLADERLREARRAAFVHCCEEFWGEEPKRSILDLFRRRQSSATCSC
jgi:hypothetical protein